MRYRNWKMLKCLWLLFVLSLFAGTTVFAAEKEEKPEITEVQSETPAPEQPLPEQPKPEQLLPEQPKPEKQKSRITFLIEYMDKVYDGKPVSAPEFSLVGNQAMLTVSWYRKEEQGWKEQSALPVDAGTYKVKAELAEDESYLSSYAERLFTIEKAESTLAFEEKDLSRAANGKPMELPALHQTGSMKDAAYVWYRKEGNEWKQLTESPVTPGDYRVIVSVEEDQNYLGTTVETGFQIYPLKEKSKPPVKNEDTVTVTVTITATPTPIPTPMSEKTEQTPTPERKEELIQTQGAKTMDHGVVMDWILTGALAILGMAGMGIRMRNGNR